MSQEDDKRELIAGDVLLCNSIDVSDRYACETGYSHAAIYIGDEKVLDANLHGVKIRSLFDLMSGYHHLAVLRSDMWSPARIRRLKEFAERHSGKPFNREGIEHFRMEKALGLVVTTQDIEDHLVGRSAPVEPNRPLYFCSELVVAAFLDAGIIDHSAAILFKPEHWRPIEVAKDKAFGFFVSYLPQSVRNLVPETDWFLSNI